MNQTRHTVVWLSANTWSYGSIYGTVQFTFPWKELIKGKRFYWVEAMPYQNAAYRILISDKDVSHLKFLTPYDPSTDKGPIRERNDTWYWNHKYTSEFMVDSDLKLSDCISFKGIAHKRDGCRIYGGNCPEREVLHFITSGRMLAFLMSSGNHAVDPALRVAPPRSSKTFSYDFENAVSGIWFALVQNKDTRFEGGIKRPEESKSIVRGALALFGADQPGEARELVSLLKDEATFQVALEAIVNDHFGACGWKLPS